MEIKIGFGIDNIVFGSSQKEIDKKLGTPDMVEKRGDYQC